MNTAQALGIAAAALVMAMDEPVAAHLGWARAEVSAVVAYSEAISHQVFALFESMCCDMQYRLELITVQ